MKNFNDFGIKRPEPGFIGPKIPMKQILGKEIIVEKFIFEPSKFGGTRLKMQITFNDIKYINFTNALPLHIQIKEVPIDGFPFRAKIIEENDQFLFIGCN